VLEFDARLMDRVAQPFLALGRAGILPSALTLLGSAPVADFCQPRMNTDATRILLNQEKENNEIEPSFLRSCFPNSIFPARFL
jgi:hypothetical protein